MTQRISRAVVVGTLFVLVVVAGALQLLRAQQAIPDLILTNGKIITVDERFTIAQSVPTRTSLGLRVPAPDGSMSWDGRSHRD